MMCLWVPLVLLGLTHPGLRLVEWDLPEPWASQSRFCRMRPPHFSRLLGPCVYVSRQFPEPNRAMQTRQLPGIYSTNTKLMNGNEGLWEENQKGAFLGSWYPCHLQQPLKSLFQIPYAIDWITASLKFIPWSPNPLGVRIFTWRKDL